MKIIKCMRVIDIANRMPVVPNNLKAALSVAAVALRVDKEILK